MKTPIARRLGIGHRLPVTGLRRLTICDDAPHGIADHRPQPPPRKPTSPSANSTTDLHRSLVPRVKVNTPLLTAEMYDDEIATLAADDADLSIDRLTVSAAPVRGLAAVSSGAMDILRRGYVLEQVRSVDHRQCALDRRTRSGPSVPESWCSRSGCVHPVTT